MKDLQRCSAMMNVRMLVAAVAIVLHADCAISGQSQVGGVQIPADGVEKYELLTELVRTYYKLELKKAEKLEDYLADVPETSLSEKWRDISREFAATLPANQGFSVPDLFDPNNPALRDHWSLVKATFAPELQVFAGVTVRDLVISHAKPK